MHVSAPEIGVFVRPWRGHGPPDMEQVRPYVEAIEASGARAVLLPLETVAPQDVVHRVSGLVLPGGAEVDPALYGEPRTWPVTDHFSADFDRFELHCLQLALPIGMPVLGICRGLQLLNVAGGGTLHQDIARDLKPRSAEVQHMQTRMQAFRNNKASPSHAIQTEDNVAGRVPHLRRLFQTSQMLVNSTHHQALASIGPQFAVAARALDGVVESIESVRSERQWGVQFHPERDLRYQPMFDLLAAQATTFQAESSR